MPVKKVLLLAVLIMVALVVVSILSRLNHSKEEVIKPADSPENPIRGSSSGFSPFREITSPLKRLILKQHDMRSSRPSGEGQRHSTVSQENFLEAGDVNL
ncbi:MAG: hypothetical protein QXS04_05425 [Thermoproteota archaeon]|nr:hypothetical protein [Candidatus Brockarchaeota archaeon]